MVLCSVKCVQQISNYLGVFPKKLHVSENNIIASNDIIKNQTIEGFSTVIQALAKASKCENILGKDEITRALTRQWLEYATLCINYADIPANAKRILKELNTALKDNTYITGTNKTVADVNELTYQDKAQYVNVSRWFDNIQQEERLRQKLNLVNFDLIHLYV